MIGPIVPDSVIESHRRVIDASAKMTEALLGLSYAEGVAALAGVMVTLSKIMSKDEERERASRGPG